MSEVINQSQQQLDDRVLLRRFVQDADEAAFEEIVRRYQKLVMSVCGRILGHGQDAEDAFQATFICLARRPRSIRHSKALSSWLYTVAYRTSWRLIRRRKKAPTETLETDPMSQSTDPLDKISDAQDCVIVDEELNRLPVKFKDVLVMTYFADQTSQQIADTLSVSKGTVDGRLRDARNMLRVKLARRGVTIGAIALAASACTEATAAVSSTVLNSTLQLGTQTLANQAVLTPDLSRINHLIRPETTIMSTKFIAATMVGIAAVGAIGFSAIVSAQQDGAVDGGTRPLNAVIDTQSKKAEETAASSTATISVFNGANGASDYRETAKNTDPFADADETSADPFGSAANSTAQSAKPAEQIYSQIPENASPIEKRIYAALEQQTPPLDFPGETPLGEALSAIMAAINKGANANDRISLVIDHKGLDTEGLTSLNDIFLRDIELPGIELRKAMKLILDQTEIDYLIRNDVLFLTTKQEALTNADYFTTRIYPVKKLLAMQSSPDSGIMGGYGGDMGMGMSGGTRSGAGGLRGGVPALREPLIELICNMTSPPCLWIDRDGDGGAISIAGNSLVVRQSQRGHEEIVQLLNLLANAKE